MTDTADKEVGRKQGILFSRGQYDFSVHNRQLSQHAFEAKHGKPVALLVCKESEPQGEPIGLRVKDCRESESLLVTSRIGLKWCTTT